MSVHKIPLYQKILHDIKDNISNGIYKAEDKLPTEEEFCTRYNTSRTTVRRALLELDQQGIIISRQGSGSIVSPQIFTQSLQRFYSFSKEMRKKGKHPSNKILSFDTIIAPANIKKIMKLEKDNEKVMRLIRLRLADNKPYMYSTNYLLLTPFIGLSQSMLENNDLYEILQERYNVIFSKAIESFRPILCDTDIASYINLDTTQPCMFINRITHSLNNIIEYTESYIRGDKFEFSIELKN